MEGTKEVASISTLIGQRLKYWDLIGRKGVGQGRDLGRDKVGQGTEWRTAFIYSQHRQHQRLGAVPTFRFIIGQLSPTQTSYW